MKTGDVADNPLTRNWLNKRNGNWGCVEYEDPMAFDSRQNGS